MAKLFLQILNMSISATYLILAIVILRLFMKKAPKWVNVLLWGLVAVRLLCPFTMESMFSLIPTAQAVSPEIITQDAPDVGGVQVEMGEAGDVSVLLPDMGGTDIGVDPLPPAPVQEAPDTEALITVLAVVWAVGVLAMVIYMGLSYQTVARRVSTAFPVGERIYESENIDSAFVLGLFRPKIYLPFALDQKKKDHIRAHEQAHIRRRDHLWKPMGFLLLAVHWFNPFMWVSYVLLCRDIELACDEKVIGDLGRMERAEYSETLLSCSVNRQKKMVYPLAFGEFDIKGRVKAVLNYKKPTVAIICLSLIVCIILAGCFLTDPVSNDDKEKEQETTLESDTKDTTESDTVADTVEDPKEKFKVIEGEFIDYEVHSLLFPVSITSFDEGFFDVDYLEQVFNAQIFERDWFQALNEEDQQKAYSEFEILKKVDFDKYVLRIHEGYSQTVCVVGIIKQEDRLVFCSTENFHDFRCGYLPLDNELVIYIIPKENLPDLSQEEIVSNSRFAFFSRENNYETPIYAR